MSLTFQIDNPVYDEVYKIYAWRDNNRTLSLVQGEGITYPNNISDDTTIIVPCAKAPRFQLRDDRGAISLASNPEVVWAVTLPSGSEDLVACNIVTEEGITAADGIIEIPIMSSTTHYSGHASGEIRIITANGSSGGITKFFGINACIGKGVSDEAAAQSPKFSALILALQKVAALDGADNIANLDGLVDGELPTNGGNPVASGVLKNLFAKKENVQEVFDNNLDTADDNKTLYIHKTNGRVKGLVIVAGDVPAYQGCTQYRFRKSGSIEYRFGALNLTTDPYSYDWGGYSATGDWKRLATLDDIPDIPEVVNPWKNKRYLSHGDSITWYDGRGYLWGEHKGEIAIGYQTIMKELLGLSYNRATDNKGRSGYTIAHNYEGSHDGSDNLVDVIVDVNIDYTAYDLCTILGGTNDYRRATPLGELGQTGDDYESLDTDTFYGAYRKCVEYILTAAPGIRLVLITPFQRNPYPAWSSYEATYDGDKPNAEGLKLIDYVNAVKLIGKMYGLPVCDLYSNSGITELTLGTYTIDGLHPNDEGFKRIGEVLAETLTTGGNNDATDLDAYLSKYLKNGSFISSQDRSKPPLYVRDDVDYGTSFLNKLIESGNTIYYNTGRIADAPAIYRLQWAILNPSPIEVMELPTGGTTYFDASEDKCVYVPYLPGELIKYNQKVFKVNVKITAKNKDYITYEYLFEEIDYYTKTEIDSMIGDIGTALDTLNDNLAEV